MPEDVGGKPFPEPDDHGADEEFASVVLDEAFVRAAPFHEPSARERLLAAAQARAAAEAARLRVGADDEAHGLVGGGYDDDDDLGLYAGHYRLRRPYGARSRWHRTIAWLLALVMGLGVVALTFAAVYRGASSSGRTSPTPPPATGPAGVPSRPPAVSTAGGR